MAIDKEQICSLLGSGLSNEIVATAVGCEPSYITQLMAEEEFYNKVIALRTASLTAHNRRDETIDSLEDKLLVKAHEIIDNGYIYKPRELVSMMAIVNGMKRRGIPSHQSVALNQTVINLNIPSKITQKFVTNSAQEVIEVDTQDGGKQSLLTMPAHTLLRRLAEKKGVVDGEKYETIRRYLPPEELEHPEKLLHSPELSDAAYRDYGDGKAKSIGNPTGLSRRAGP